VRHFPRPQRRTHGPLNDGVSAIAISIVPSCYGAIAYNIAIAHTPSHCPVLACRVPCDVTLHATTIRFADRGYAAIARAAESQGISVSQYVREAALIRAVLDDLDTAEEALHTAHDLLGVAREVRRLAEVDAPGPQRQDARS
jgi:uncharacterized protein (DUF1778 family)